MKSLGIICGGVALVLSMVATASADERSAPISKSSLSSMGLGSIQVMSDREGLAVRGKGFSMGGFGGSFGRGFGSSFCSPRPSFCQPWAPVRSFCNFGGGQMTWR